MPQEMYDKAREKVGVKGAKLFSEKLGEGFLNPFALQSRPSLVVIRGSAKIEGFLSENVPRLREV